MTTYRRSALLSAMLRMWRAWTVIVPVVVVNAIVQALLVIPQVDVAQGWLGLLVAAVSAVLFAVSFGLAVAAALQVPGGRVSWRMATAKLRQHAVRYGLWALGLLVAFVAARAVNEGLALILLGLTPFVLLAAVDGRGNPLVVNMSTIGKRFWRWLVTAVIIGGVVVVGTLLSGFTAFFVRGGAASLIVWLVAGVVISWFTTAWALIYRNVWAAT